MTFTTSPYEGTPETVTNGHSFPSPPLESPPSAAPRVPRRETWVDLPGEYGEAGMKVKIWINYPRSLTTLLTSGDAPKIKQALLQIVVDHNGWVSFDGTPYPPASDAGEVCTKEHPEGEECPGVIRPGFWEVISDELAGALIMLTSNEQGKLATSLIPTPRRR